MRAIELIEQKVSTLVGKQEVKTICSIDDPPICNALGLFEPSDVKIQRSLYVDTNNSLIKSSTLTGKYLKTHAIKD